MRMSERCNDEGEDGEPPHGALLGFLRAGDIDFAGAFRHFGEYRDAFAQNLSKAADDRDRIGYRAALRAIHQFADAEFRDQRGVAWENA